MYGEHVDHVMFIWEKTRPMLYTGYGVDVLGNTEAVWGSAWKIRKYGGIKRIRCRHM